MRTIDYQTILEATSNICALDQDNISNDEFRILRSFHSDRLHTAWEFEFWPEVLRTQKRYFRALWVAATAYTAGTTTSATEVYYPSSGKYYQAIKNSTGEAPADSSDDTNTAYWADAKSNYSANEYVAATAYAAGDQVYYAITDRYYQCHTASTGNLPSDTSYWGVLTEFDRYVGYEQTGETALGEVLCVWDKNPKTTTKLNSLNWNLSENGVQVLSQVSECVILFKTRVPILKGEVFDATATYSVGDQIYYSSTSTRGNFYECIVATSAGEDPDDTAASWSVVQIPLIFKEWLENAAYADWLIQEGEVSKSQAREQMAYSRLYDKAENLTGAQDQRKKTIVLTR